MSTEKPLDLYWFIPVSGDGTQLGTAKGHRPADFDYLKQIAQAADRLGFGGVLIPTGKNCDDPWITAAALASHTERLRFLLALRPGVASPTYVARQAAALDRISNGRFLVNIVSGGNPAELAGDGIHLSHDERYAHASEFLEVYTRLLEGEKVTFEGKYIQVKNAELGFRLVHESLSNGLAAGNGLQPEWTFLLRLPRGSFAPPSTNPLRGIGARGEVSC